MATILHHKIISTVQGGAPLTEAQIQTLNKIASRPGFQHTIDVASTVGTFSIFAIDEKGRPCSKGPKILMFYENDDIHWVKIFQNGKIKYEVSSSKLKQ